MFDFAALERRVAALEANRGASLRFGVVTGVDAAGGSVRVQLPDGDGMVSAPLRVLQRRSLKDKAQCLPDIGEPVACLFSGQGLESGVLLGAHYSTQAPAPGQEASTDYVVYEDGTQLWYDRKAHKLIARVKGDAEVETEGQITARAKKTVVVESGTGVTLKAPTITLTGKVFVPEEDLIVGGVSVRRHTHSGVKSGLDTTDAPREA